MMLRSGSLPKMPGRDMTSVPCLMALPVVAARHSSSNFRRCSTARTTAARTNLTELPRPNGSEHDHILKGPDQVLGLQYARAQAQMWSARQQVVRCEVLDTRYLCTYGLHISM